MPRILTLADVYRNVRRSCYCKKADDMPVLLNDYFQPLVLKYKDRTINEQENEELGYWANSIAEILMNNRKFKHQEPYIKEECRSEAILGIFASFAYFDPNRISKRTGKVSKAYSYAFRVAYTSAIHVLESYNNDREHLSTLDSYEAWNEILNRIDKDCFDEY